MLGLNDIEEILGQLDDEANVVDFEEMEEEAQAVKHGETSADIKDPDEIIGDSAEDLDVDGDSS